MSRNVTPGTGQSSIGRTRRSIKELTGLGSVLWFTQLR